MTDQTVPAKDRATAQRYDVIDGHRNLTFTGWLLGEANSQSGHDVRWTELAMYLTLGGRYVIEKIGRSDVFHTDNCPRGSKGKKYDRLEDAMPADASDDDTVETLFVKCAECQPPYTVEPAWVERDIFSVTTFTSPNEAINSLHRRDGDTPRPLSRVARALLDEAEKNDPGIARALSAPADIT